MGRDEFEIRAPLKMPVCEANDQIRQTFFQIALHRQVYDRLMPDDVNYHLWH